MMTDWAFRRLCDSSLFRVKADRSDHQREKSVSTETYLIRIAVCGILAPAALLPLLMSAPILLMSYLLKFDFIPEGQNSTTTIVLGMLASKWFAAAVFSRYWLDLIGLTHREKPAAESFSWKKVKAECQNPIAILRRTPQFFSEFIGSILGYSKPDVINQDIETAKSNVVNQDIETESNSDEFSQPDGVNQDSGRDGEVADTSD